MTETSVQLPIRLVPRRGQALFLLFFMLIWCGFVVYWTFAFVPEFLSTQQPLSVQHLGPDLLVLLAPVFMLGVGLFGILRAFLLLLPGSPFVHLEFTQDGLTWRHFTTNRRAGWAEIRQFNLTREKSGKSYKWVLLANSAAPERNQNTLFKIELGKFLSAFGGEKEARSVTAWFNSLPALARGGKLPDRLPLPESLAPSLFRRQVMPRGRDTAVATASSRRKSVIER